MVLSDHLPATASEGSFADSASACDDLQDWSPGPLLVCELGFLAEEAFS